MYGILYRVDIRCIFHLFMIFFCTHWKFIRTSDAILKIQSKPLKIIYRIFRWIGNTERHFEHGKRFVTISHGKIHLWWKNIYFQACAQYFSERFKPSSMLKREIWLTLWCHTSTLWALESKWKLWGKNLTSMSVQWKKELQ